VHGAPAPRGYAYEQATDKNYRPTFCELRFPGRMNRQRNARRQSPVIDDPSFDRQV